MANVTEVSQFDSGIYQLKTTDVVEGGALGVDNYQAKGLANRTRWLYDRLAKYTPKNRGYVNGIDINGFTVGHPYGVGGEATASVITQDIGSGEVIRVTIPNDMGSTNYKVDFTIQSLGNMDTDNNMLPILFKPISSTQFDMMLEEIAAGVSSIRVHFEVTSLD